MYSFLKKRPTYSDLIDTKMLIDSESLKDEQISPIHAINPYNNVYKPLPIIFLTIFFLSAMPETPLVFQSFAHKLQYL